MKPNTNKLLKTALSLLVPIGAQLSSVFAQGTAFTYQGQLKDGSLPANGIYDFRFALYDAVSSGAQQGISLTNSATIVSNGLFMATLDFGNQFPGAARWLEIGVRSGGGNFATLVPRQPVTPSPYAIAAGSVTGPINGASILTGTITSVQLAAGAAAANLAGSAQSAVPSGGMILSSNFS